MREAISKKTRFEVFKRDGFCCAYCGAHPSETVVLEVDHVHPARLASIRAFLSRLDYYEVQEAMEIATDKMYSKGPAFRYFCGICWRKIRPPEAAPEESA